MVDANLNLNLSITIDTVFARKYEHAVITLYWFQASGDWWASLTPDVRHGPWLSNPSSIYGWSCRMYITMAMCAYDSERKIGDKLFSKELWPTLAMCMWTRWSVFCSSFYLSHVMQCLHQSRNGLPCLAG
jgi:hypothetical protein